jgi:hypothetical protein
MTTLPLLFFLTLWHLFLLCLLPPNNHLSNTSISILFQCVQCVNSYLPVLLLNHSSTNAVFRSPIKTERPYFISLNGSYLPISYSKSLKSVTGLPILFEIKASKTILNSEMLSFVLIYAVLLHCCINNLEKTQRRASISGSRFRAVGRSENPGGGGRASIIVVGIICPPSV